MEGPDERQMHADLCAASFLIGQSKGRWGRVAVEPAPKWPMMHFWIGAAKRKDAPDRFYLRLDCAGYPTRPPTGGFWDPETKDTLAAAKWPKGIKRVEDVFKYGWRDGKALY